MTTGEETKMEHENRAVPTRIGQSSRLPNVSRMTSSEIKAAIHGDRPEAAWLIERASVCLANFYDPDQDPKLRAAVRATFAKSLADLPKWAIDRGFAEWERTMTRRPTPADIRILAEREVEPFGKEAARRERLDREHRQEAEDRDRQRVTPEAAARIIAEAGMTPDRLMAIKRFPMASSADEAEAKLAEITKPGHHWSEGANPDDPKWDALRRSREKAGSFGPPR